MSNAWRVSRLKSEDLEVAYLLETGESTIDLVRVTHKPTGISIEAPTRDEAERVLEREVIKRIHAETFGIADDEVALPRNKDELEFGIGWAERIDAFDSSLLNTTSIRSLYRHAELFPDGTWKSGGYKPDDRIGYSVLDTVRGLCNEVDRLRGLIQAVVEQCDNEIDIASMEGVQPEGQIQRIKSLITGEQGWWNR